MTRVRWFGCSAVLCAASFGASAQTVTFGTVTTTVDATTASVPVTYVAGGGVVSYQIDLSITRGGISPIAPNGAVTRLDVDGTCSGNAIVTATGTAIRITDIDLDNEPLPSGTNCVLTFPLDVGNLTNGDTTSIGGDLVFTEFSDPWGITAGTVVPGSITVINAPRQGPQLTYDPDMQQTIQFPPVNAIGGIATRSIRVSGTGGQNSGTTTIDQCVRTSGTGGTIEPGAPMICTAGGICLDGSDDSITATCTATALQQTGIFSCRETRQAESLPADGNTIVTMRYWDFSCPAADVAPIITPAIPSGGNVSTTPVGLGQTSAATISFSATNGSGTATTTVSDCSIGGPFTLNPANPTLTFTGSTGPSPQAFRVQCTAGVAVQGPGNLTCNIGGTSYSVAVTCAPGLSAAPPILAANPGEDADGVVDGTPEVVFPAPQDPNGASFATINLDVSGGLDDGNAPAETVAITGCEITNNVMNNLSVVMLPPATPFGAGDPEGDRDASFDLRCYPNSGITNGVLRCSANSVTSTGTTTAIHLWELECPARGGTAPPPAPIFRSRPASPATIPVDGPLGTRTNATVVFESIWQTPLSVTNCSASPDAPGITFTPPETPIPAFGTGALGFSCVAPAPGTVITETVRCGTNDPAQPLVSFTLACAGENPAAIPAVDGRGKILMATLLIGLGLLVLGLWRRTV